MRGRANGMLSIVRAKKERNLAGICMPGYRSDLAYEGTFYMIDFESNHEKESNVCLRLAEPLRIGPLSIFDGM
jgi:hypothetical protein